MKYARKTLSLLLIAALMISLFSSCAGTGILNRIDKWDTVQLEYTLTEQDLTDFENKVAEVRDAFLNATTLDDASAAIYPLYSYYSRFIEQSHIAEILYYCHQNDKTAEANYLFATSATEKAGTVITELETELYESNSAIRSEYFEGLTDEEIQSRLKLSDAVGKHNVLISELISDYYGNEEYADGEGRALLYNKLILAGQELAELTGYENYYEYTSDSTYYRDYGKEERNLFRDYVAEYIAPLYYRAAEKYEDAYNNLSYKQTSAFAGIMESTAYNKLEKNYLQEYIQSLKQSTASNMNHMFEKNNFICADWSDSALAAFTTYINAPFCYFGPDAYQSLFIVTHELGHYCASLALKTDVYSFDIGETHSQGNEMLLLTFLKDSMDSAVYETMVAYEIYSVTHSILLATVIDHFEETIYSDPNSGSYTKEDYERILTERIMPKYNLSEELKTILLSNWEEIRITSPCYYISYATSGIAALNLFELAQKDYEAATEAYRKITEELDETAAFTGTLKSAGIASPFEEQSFIDLSKLIA